MDKNTRNELRKTVINCRKALESSIGDELEGNYGIYRNGKIDEESFINHLSEEEKEFRKQLLVYIKHIESGGFGLKKAIEQMIREVSYTHLNRLSAYKMMEVRGLIKETVSRGLNSNGFKFYLVDHNDDEHLWNRGHQYAAYKHYLEWLGGKLSEEIGVLFSPHDPANRLFPKQPILEEILSSINNPDLSEIWDSDETIGWIYQYFTPKELRDKARKESQAPRNSYELAFRNQFFTPRYVVEFLTDNTLGRIWYEMRKGDSILKERCQYLVIRPNEIFLQPGEKAPTSENDNVDSELVQEELLKKPVYIQNRDKKDPREIKILDPACGSGHFLLYCFDLLEVIYEEAYDDPDLGIKLKEDYHTKEDLIRAIPSLIISRNLHGVDIDQRAIQIAALAIWLRAQKSYNDQKIQSEKRPKITRSNLVVAEPMPGNRKMLDDFISGLSPPIIGQLVKSIFEKMELAGEIGTLLKIEEEIKSEIADAKQRWLTKPRTVQIDLFGDKIPNSYQVNLDFSGITDEDFWNRAESLLLESLKNYAEGAVKKEKLAIQLFVDDAKRGFAFIENCRNKYDIALMNPPFGEYVVNSGKNISKKYKEYGREISATFIERCINCIVENGKIGCIVPRAIIISVRLSQFREGTLLEKYRLNILVDMGYGVLDAAIETAALVIDNIGFNPTFLLFETNEYENKGKLLLDNVLNIGNLSKKTKVDNIPLVKYHSLINLIPDKIISGWIPSWLAILFKKHKPIDPNFCEVRKGLITGDDFRFLRLPSEVRNDKIGLNKKWRFFPKGGPFSPFFSDIDLIINWENDGSEIKNNAIERYNSETRTIKNQVYFGMPGIGYSMRSSIGFSARIFPQGTILADDGPIVLHEDIKIRTILLGLLNSSIIIAILKIWQGGKRNRYQWISNSVQNIPLPKLDNFYQIITPTESIYRSLWIINSNNETSNYFICPVIIKNVNIFESYKSIISNYQNEMKNIGREYENIEKIIAEKMDINLNDIKLLRNHLFKPNENLQIHYISKYQSTLQDYLRDLLSYYVGVIFGRWDIRRIFNSCSRNTLLKDFFSEISSCPPGMLINPQRFQGKNGQITSEEGTCNLLKVNTLPKEDTDSNPIIQEEEYPIIIDWDGILVDDPNHADDIIRRIRYVFEIVWFQNPDSMEQEMCEMLSVKELRDYFQKPGHDGFWMNHVKRYSKSRRKSPIYWLLQSSNKNYALWLYYHRLDRDIYHKALIKYVLPKISLEESKLNTLRSEKDSLDTMGSDIKRLEIFIEESEALLIELYDFRDKLKKVTDLNLEPDLDDGVVLNIAPLHELVPWKEAKKYWDELLAGKYEWSSISKQLKERGLI